MRCNVKLAGALALVLFGGPLRAACPDDALLGRLADMSRLPAKKVATQLADDALLGPYARAHYGEALRAQSRVGSSYQRQLDEQWLALIAPYIQDQAKAAQQRARFTGTILELDGKQWSATDLQGLNLQERLLLQDGNQAGLAGLLWQEAKLALAPGWLGWPADRLTCSRTLVENRLDRVWLMERLGLAGDPHHENAELKRLAASVTAGEIADYYQAHQADFRELAWVKVRLFEAPDQETLAKLPPSAPVLLERPQAQGDVLKTLAFVTPEQGRSPAIRLPSGRYGQVEVLERHYELPAADSETVAYVARQALAKEKAKANWQALLAQLRKETP
ncbi:hypothetical protein PVT67_06175 [Gallaecimonas kandeliae]|uniref:hypothetical protein n=1 Tax=Gallaecimonas kandeliae TaxID=3029055 RepID=UPI0026496BA1|nr:hypothetical protein [Gallaecimonas kandeliae]WKE66819.1 hypothetical protein PVT67_06175 [Gallaecimonas kandeliae]